MVCLVKARMSPIHALRKTIHGGAGSNAVCAEHINLCMRTSFRKCSRVLFNWTIDNTVQVDTQRGNKRRGPRKYIETLTASGVGVLHKVVKLFLRF